MGVSFPIDLSNTNRALNHLHNIQIQYKPPEVPLYWWSWYNTSIFPISDGHQRGRKRSPSTGDDYLYQYLERLFPDDCLKRWFCEMARIPLSRREDDVTSTIISPAGENLLIAILESIFR